MKTSTRDSSKESSIKGKTAALSVRKTNVPAGIYNPLIDSGSRMVAQAKLQENWFGQMAQRQPLEDDELIQGKRAAQNGNRYSQRLGESMNVQAKLTVNAPNDVYEQEADKVAKAVTRAASSQVQRQPEEEEELQTKLASQGQRQEVPEEEEELQMQLAKSQPATVCENLENRIKAARGSGHPLSDVAQKPMEQAFGNDFGGVRVHTDAEANILNQHLSAEAFTTGQDIFFRQGTYQPNSESGKGLLAHELTHVVQQRAVPILQSQADQDISAGSTTEDEEAYNIEMLQLQDISSKEKGLVQDTKSNPRSVLQNKELILPSAIQLAPGKSRWKGRGGSKWAPLPRIHDELKEEMAMTSSASSIQRWELEGPWNYGQPVHEKLTEKALKAAQIIGIDDNYKSEEAWEYTRGALWNDDPEGLLFDDRNWFGQRTTTKYSSGAKFGTKFKRGEKKAEKGAMFGPEEVSLLKRSHFGDLQFLHGMAVQGEEAAKTRENMLMWAEFTYKVGIGVISGDTELQQVEVQGIPELFPALSKGTTVAMLFCIRANLKDLADVKKRAIGSLLHMVQDTYAASHTEREYTPGKEPESMGPFVVTKKGIVIDTRPGLKKGVGKIKEFHSYTGQEKKKHAAKDVPSGYSEEEWKAREASAVDAGVGILTMVKLNASWEIVKPMLEFVLGLVEKPAVAGPGEEYKT